MKLKLNLITADRGSKDLLNGNFQAIQSFMEDVVSRSGAEPNHMEADFDMNGNTILNADIEIGDAGIGLKEMYEEIVRMFNEMKLIEEALLNFTISTLPPSGGEDGDLWYQH